MLTTNQAMSSAKTIVDIKSGALFPWPFLLLGGGFFLAGIGLFLTSPIIAIILLLLGASMVTGYEGTQVDRASSTYREYRSFLFLKTGERKKYDSIEKIFVNSAKVTQRIYTAHTMSSATFSNVEYNAYLKFSDGVKVFLLSERKKARLLRKLEAIGRELDIPVTDNTVSHIN
jgi:hypothetical protein